MLRRSVRDSGRGGRPARSVPRRRHAPKPSPSRWHLRDQVNRANALIREYVARDKRLTYIDVYAPMIGADGRPREELFGAAPATTAAISTPAMINKGR